MRAGSGLNNLHHFKNFVKKFWRRSSEEYIICMPDITLLLFVPITPEYLNSSQKTELVVNKTFLFFFFSQQKLRLKFSSFLAISRSLIAYIRSD